MKKLILTILFSAVFAVTGFGLAQQVDLWCIGNFCINASSPVGSPTITVTPPTRAGKLALTSDIVAGTVAIDARGIITLSNGVGSAALTGFSTIPICVVSDGSGNSVKYTNTATLLSVAGVGPSVAFICK